MMKSEQQAIFFTKRNDYTVTEHTNYPGTDILAIVFYQVIDGYMSQVVSAWYLQGSESLLNTSKFFTLCSDTQPRPVNEAALIKIVDAHLNRRKVDTLL